MRWVTFVLAVLLLLLPDDAGGSGLDGLHQRLEQIVEREGLVGLGYVVVEEGEVAWAGALGRVAPDGEAMTPETTT